MPKVLGLVGHRSTLHDTIGPRMFLRPNHRSKDGKDDTYWSLVKDVRTRDGPRQKTLWYLGELNSSAAGTMVEDHRGIQRAGGNRATDTIPLPGRGTGRRSAGGARAPKQGASGEDATVRRLLAGTATVEATEAAWFL